MKKVTQTASLPRSLNTHLSYHVCVYLYKYLYPPSNSYLTALLACYFYSTEEQLRAAGHGQDHVPRPRRHRHHRPHRRPPQHGRPRRRIPPALQAHLGPAAQGHGSALLGPTNRYDRGESVLFELFPHHTGLNGGPVSLREVRAGQNDDTEADPAEPVVRSQVRRHQQGGRGADIQPQPLLVPPLHHRETRSVLLSL